MRLSLAFWRSDKQRDRVVAGARKPKQFRPWQLRQWLGLDGKGKPLRAKLPPSIETRQRRRAAFRALSFENITKQYGGEPRHARRGIAIVLARRAYREHMKSHA